MEVTFSVAEQHHSYRTVIAHLTVNRIKLVITSYIYINIVYKKIWNTYPIMDG